MFKTILAIVLVIGLLVGYPMLLYSTEEKQTITISEKWVKYQDETQKYHVSDENGNVYEVTDELLYLTFDASNRYANLKEGNTYTVTTVGWRIPILSMYKNIVAID